MILSATYAAAGLAFLALAFTVAVRALRKPAPYEPDGSGGVLTGRPARPRLHMQRDAVRQAVAKE